MFHPIYQNGGKILRIVKPPVGGKMTQELIVEIKTFRLQTSKLLGNRRKTYILDVICNKSYFGKVQEEVVG